MEVTGRHTMWFSGYCMAFSSFGPKNGEKHKINICQEWDSNPRLQQETRRPNQFNTGNPFDTCLSLAPSTTRPSWQLDFPNTSHVSIKSVIHKCSVAIHWSRIQKELSGVGFEPTPPSGDQKAPRAHSNDGKVCNLESGALDRSAIVTVRTLQLTN